MTTRSVRLSILALCIFTSALISGFFYAYYCSVMPGLAATDPESAIKAMQGINAVVRNATFAFSFFGTLAFGAVAIVLLIGAGGWPLAFALSGTAIYGVGAFMVTMLCSVPLNEALATVTPTPQDAPRIWRDYLEPWTLWNGLRTLMSILALAAFTASFVTLFVQPYTARGGGARITPQAA
ncbi:anthrone oxygenase family protein [Bradyrhizobium sp. LHD-71]|uniref:anthrone oxygenase family protein n=1 Tax=Bradyrhizobium sp. LHD-71 TaxID=3072141 RepID=UPI00280E9A1E|nr:anthrone oxygenase family protein [Bradyrhizobium sp. LHD-71]MDQ8732215.1 DUF1772 domain-containing protein [Bradyrhizobium sp. LHD-71]